MPTKVEFSEEVPNVEPEAYVVGYTGQQVTDTQVLLGTVKQSRKCLAKHFLLEFVVFFYMFSFALTSACNTNLNMDRACTVIFNRTSVECTGNDTYLFDQVQIIANDFNLYINLMRVLPSSILGIFIGPWADKYGRKPPIYFAMIGTVLSSALMIWYAAASRAQLYFSIIANLPEGISGSTIGVLSSLYTMASESTVIELRTLKYTTLQLSILISLPLGILIGGVIYEYYQYVPVYCLSCASYIVALLIFFFSEDKSDKCEATLKSKILDFFKCDSIKDNIRIIIKKRENKGRTQIILLMVSVTVTILNYVSVDGTLYLFCEKMFRWTMTYYSEVSAIAHISGGIFVLVCVSGLHRIQKVSDSWMGLLGALSLFTQSIFKALSLRPWMYYMAIVFGLPGTMATISIRSSLSKIIHKKELGKIFSLLGIVESFIPLVGSLMVTLVYNASVEFFPGLTILLAGFLVLFPIMVFIWLISLPRQQRNHISDESNDVTGSDAQESVDNIHYINSSRRERE